MLVKPLSKYLNLKVLGTVGVLMRAKKAGKLANLRENLDALRDRGGFRLSQTIYVRAPREAGEL